jgi:hypothetical protein
MNRSVTIGMAVAAAGLLGLVAVSRPRRERMGAFVSGRMMRHMENMMERMPENAPPKLVMSVLPRLREQNDEIIAMLREQNALLREQLQRPH